MSTNFEIFPTNKKIPECEEIIKYSVRLFDKFLQRKNILHNITVAVREVSIDNKVNISPIFLVSKETFHTVFNLNREGEAYVFYHQLTELDREFWNEELQVNKNAWRLKEKIDANLDIGYSWSVKRTMGQPAIVSLYYGYLAIAIAVLTEGIIYSDDGAWDYSCLPVEGIIFEEDYLNLDKISDDRVKENIEKWLDKLKK